MKKYVCDTSYEYFRQIDYFILTDDIAVVHMEDTIYGKTVKNEYFFYHPKYVESLRITYNNDVVHQVNGLRNLFVKLDGEG